MKQTVSLFGLLLILVGLLFTLQLVQRQVQYRGRAEIDFGQTFSVSVGIGSTEPVVCEGTTCTTNADHVQVEFDENTTQDLLNSLP